MTYIKQLRSGEVFRSIDGGEGAHAPASCASFEPSHLMLGVESLTTRVDHVDSSLEISQRACASAGYNCTTTVPIESSNRNQLNGAAFLISTNFSHTPSANLGFSIDQQVVEPTSDLGSFLLNLQARRAVITFKRRTRRRSQINRALALRELLRYALAGCSIPGSIN